MIFLKKCLHYRVWCGNIHTLIQRSRANRASGNQG
nr:MAG TPA: hypothetical protein [Bacteriophage sp.]